MSDHEPEEKRRPGYVYDPEAPLPDHLKPKAEAPYRSKYREGDSAEKAFRFKAFTWSLTGMLLGALCGAYYAIQTGKPAFLYMLGGGLFVWSFSFFGSLFFAESLGKAGASIIFGSGSTTPSSREYSFGDSLVVRGKFEEAAREYERAAGQFGADPEPALRLARLQRDHLHNNEEAVRWFRAASTRKDCDEPTEIGALRELIEVYTHRMREPVRALPDLARLVDRHGATTSGEWARRQIAEIKRHMQEHNT